jgi:hypothetical protein
MQMQEAKYTAEFKEEAVRQVIDRGHSVIDVAKRLGIGDGLLYTWVNKFKVANEPVAIDDMKSMQAEFTLSGICRVLDVHRSGFNTWLLEPLSPRAMETQ